MEKTPERHLENPDEKPELIALGTMKLRSHDEMVAYRPDGGIDVMRFIETGETQLRTFGVGDKTISFEVEVQEPLQCASYDTWRDYAIDAGAQLAGDRPDYTNRASELEHEDGYTPERDEILRLAIEQAETLGDYERVEPCRRACGDGMQTGDCMCTRMRSSYTTIDGETVKEPKPEGEADPGCTQCGGTGKESYRCWDCSGAGESIINPIVSIVNRTTGEQTSFRLEVAKLLAEGDIQLGLTHQRYLRPGDDMKITARMYMDDFMARKALEVGIDINNDEYITYWGDRPLETFGTTFGHLLRQMSVDVELPSNFETTEEFAAAALEELQKRIACDIRTDIYGPSGFNRQRATTEAIREVGKTFDIDFNENLTVSRVGLHLERPPRSNEILRELIEVLDSDGYRLGFTSTGIATGETGPALYVLDRAGNIVQEIDSGYNPAIVLLNTYKTIKQARENGGLGELTEDY